MNEKMTPEEAIKILDNVAAKYMGTRQDHALLTQALQILKDFIQQPS